MTFDFSDITNHWMRNFQVNNESFEGMQIFMTVIVHGSYLPAFEAHINSISRCLVFSRFIDARKGLRCMHGFFEHYERLPTIEDKDICYVQCLGDRWFKIGKNSEQQPFILSECKLVFLDEG